ncbi:putative 2,4-dichlorophenol 6-monooxygenase [Halenospora varia]|nr:putative 2,4-dichlorophenol 6-monooxygenase [Halenospora varia]
MPPLTTPVVIVGGGPVGMLIAFNLARFGVPCILAEVKSETCLWPRMDLAYCRTVEIFRMMGIAEEFRVKHELATGTYSPDNRLYTSSSPSSQQSPHSNSGQVSLTGDNDGTGPAELGQRCSHVVIEAWLKRKCLEQASIDCRFGWKYLSHREVAEGVESFFVDENGNSNTVRSQNLVGADGRSSSVRQNCAIKMFGTYLPGAIFLVYFRSKEFSSLRPFGRFRNMFSPSPGWIIDQQETDTFTAHKPLDSPDQDTSLIDPHEWIYEIAGEAAQPHRFKIDEIIVTSAWCPSFAVAERYMSQGGRVVLAGDACHRTPSHGSHGLNTGIEDALALSWRLSTILKTHGGPHLLPSYQTEQRTTIMRRLAHAYTIAQSRKSGLALWETHGQSEFIAEAVGGEALRAQVKTQLDEAGSTCSDLGIELDMRFSSSVIFKEGGDGEEEVREWDAKKYFPTTYPGHRAPHVLLSDNTTSILDLLGPEFSLVSFTTSTDNNAIPHQANFFITLASEMGLEIHNSLVDDEEHAHGVWGGEKANFVLVRPDGYVAWRSMSVPSGEEIRRILRVVLGWTVCPGYVESEMKGDEMEFLRTEYPETT